MGANKVPSLPCWCLGGRGRSVETLPPELRSGHLHQTVKSVLRNSKDVTVPPGREVAPDHPQKLPVAECVQVGEHRTGKHVVTGQNSLHATTQAITGNNILTAWGISKASGCWGCSCPRRSQEAPARGSRQLAARTARSSSVRDSKVLSISNFWNQELGLFDSSHSGFHPDLRVLHGPGPSRASPNTSWASQKEFLPAPLQLQEGKVGIMDPNICSMYFRPPDSTSSQYAVCRGPLDGKVHLPSGHHCVREMAHPARSSHCWLRRCGVPRCVNIL
ncbi:Transmembrane protease serine 9 [Manis javanica]|nr:Transmembrane protease serine 9 [Manis javanica]